MISRAVPLTEEQYLFIEDLGKEFIRAEQHETATKLLAIALAWKVSPIVHYGNAFFGCDIDESAGMAEVHDACGCERCHPEIHNVIEMQGYSRKVPCA